MVLKSLYPVIFKPIPMERLWGGGKLKKLFNIEASAQIGEYWVLSAHPNGMSEVVNGPLTGKTLAELIKEYPKEFLGNFSLGSQSNFPLLIKFIEAADDLSVQVHPNDEYALRVERDFGKTEAWYILEHSENGQIIYGHNFENKEQFRDAIATNRVKDHLSFKDIKKDELVFVPSQTLHAILAGTILIEIQQSSDVTYRVYDWERVDDKGQGRELHLDKALDVMGFSNNFILSQNNVRITMGSNEMLKWDRLVTCQYFIVDELTIKNNAKIEQGRNGNPDILIIVSGEGKIVTDNYTEGELIVKQGYTILIPSSITYYEIETVSGLKCLRTFY